MQRSPRFWALWANPVFHRYRRSRMRLGRLIPWSICVLILASFIFLLPYTIFYHHIERGDAVKAARATLLPMLIFQGLILMLKGTFSVASGITREASEGILDYQRLTPMTPLGKIVGYLFGLPIREYLLFFLTVPFTCYATIVGKVPLASIAQVYAVFFSATLLYHMTGFLAGTVVKRKMLAGVLSQMLILVIYWILPNLSFVGYAVFEYLTLYPVVYEQGAQLFPELVRQFPQLKDNSAYFYAWTFRPAPFSIAVQLSLVCLFTVVVHRHWRDPGHHLLGKHFALVTYVLLILVLLGTTMPLIKSGMIFFSQVMMEMEMGQRFGKSVKPEEALLATGIFGLISSFVAVLMSAIITPTADSYRKGIHRARKLQLRFQPPGADSSVATWHTLAMVLTGAICWCWFTGEIMDSGWIKASLPTAQYAPGLILAFGLPVIVCQLILEGGGKRAFFLWLVFGWVAPILTSVILGIISEDLIEASIYLGSISGFSLIFYAAQEAFPSGMVEIGSTVKSALRVGFWIQGIVLVFMAIRVFLQKLKLIRQLKAT